MRLTHRNRRRRALAHEAEGRIPEAIAEWVALNRLAPEPWIDEHLIDLRCDELLTRPRGPGAESWPPTYPDPFPSVVGAPPEITAGELTVDRLGGGLRHHGCVLVRGLLASDTTQTL